MQFLAELTDTMQGQANYCWVHRATLDAPANAATRLLVRRAKRALSLSNSRHTLAWDCGEMLRLDFHNSATCLPANKRPAAMSLAFNRVLQSFLCQTPRRLGNYSTDGATLHYYCSPILVRHENGQITMSLCGKPSLTAKRCLNEFLQAIGRPERFHTIKGQLMLGHTPVSASDRLPLPNS